MELVIVWLLLAGGIGFLADSRGRSGFGFFLLSALLSPLLGLIVVLVVSNLKEVEAQEHRRIADERTKERVRREEHERQLESIKAIAAPQKIPSTQQRSVGAASISVADEIRKLAALRGEGLLTDAEFQSQKSVLLSSSLPTPATAVELDNNSPKESVPATPQNVGICPNCDATISLFSRDCPKCKANFTDGSTWSVKAL